MIFIFKKATYGCLTGLLLFASGIITLNCTSAYHGPPRFSYENRSYFHLDRKASPADKSVLNHQASNPSESEKVTTINDRAYILRRTANNLWHLVEKPTEDKSINDVISAGCCRPEKNRNDSTFCYNAINTLCEISEILVNLTGFNPIVRACLVASLKFIKPFLYLICAQVDNTLTPGLPMTDRT